jgi:hypothetical protein
MNKCIKILGFMLMAIVIQSCATSFRSTQLDLLMLAIKGTEEVPAEELAWTLLWSGDTYTLLPVVSTDGSMINYVNEDGTLIVVFDVQNTWQVLLAYGLLPDVQTLRISKSEAGLEYSNDQQLLYSHECGNFISNTIGIDIVRTQSCVTTEGETYENEIRVNSDGFIYLLRFMVDEDYPMITLTPNNLNFSNNN